MNVWSDSPFVSRTCIGYCYTVTIKLNVDFDRRKKSVFLSVLSNTACKKSEMQADEFASQTNNDFFSFSSRTYSTWWTGFLVIQTHNNMLDAYVFGLVLKISHEKNVFLYEPCEIPCTTTNAHQKRNELTNKTRQNGPKSTIDVYRKDLSPKQMTHKANILNAFFHFVWISCEYINLSSVRLLVFKRAKRIWRRRRTNVKVSVQI